MTKNTNTKAPKAIAIFGDSSGRSFYVCRRHAHEAAVRDGFDTWGLIREDADLVGNHSVLCGHRSHR